MQTHHAIIAERAYKTGFGTGAAIVNDMHFDMIAKSEGFAQLIHRQDTIVINPFATVVGPSLAAKGLFDTGGFKCFIEWEEVITHGC